MKLNLLSSITLAAFLCAYTTKSYANENEQETASEIAEATVAVDEHTDFAELTEEQQYQLWVQQTLESLTPINGVVEIDGVGATLNIPEQYYFLNQQDSKVVLEDIWGNPPSETVLGMLLPTGLTPFDMESWAVTIEFSEDGYVSDEDAADIDYSELLLQMQKDTLAANAEREEAGYPAMQLVGWVSQPFYDQQSNKLHWAKEINFAGHETNTLNYNIRVLGRKGVLVLNFIAGMDQKDIIDDNLDSVLAIAEFDAGSRYADFDPEIDEVAAYGVGALVAGKVLAKTGFLAAAIMFLKKFGIFILIGIGALLKKVFSRKPKAEEATS
ncbi:DUF2167 domain-containing protein [Thalassotalea sp. PS06]|uniref:DUF2167 domain-containing protein n=1 Tax=Thalassotalea sp. PS06 TaxID=2594005 RepID=UPI001163A1D7|nr:DUF2167 domain-containing protein [Thalassotalea sp. PS06]QDP02605.1 DUF2167 domain-containing protein [Thalassotalea sp. PS06]